MTNEWDYVDEKTKDLKFPIVFLFNILKNKKELNDYNLSIILRYFIKNNIEFVLSYPINIFIFMLDDTFSGSKKIVYNFYNFYERKIEIIEKIQKFIGCFRKSEDLILMDVLNNFSNKLFDEQKEEINKLNIIYNSYYDAGYNSEIDFIKYLCKLNNANDLIYEEEKRRLRNIYLLFGHKFFEEYNINLLSVNDFNKLENDDKNNIIYYYYVKISKVLKSITNCYQFIEIYDNELKQLLNPKPIIIKNITINDNELTSDNDFMELLIEN